MMGLGLLTLLAAAALPAAAQDTQLTALDRGGDLYTVMNLFTGANEYVQVRKASSGGMILWTQSRNSFVEERAAATAVDPTGGIMVAAIQRLQGRRTMILFHYTTDGQYDWQQTYNDNMEDVPTVAAVDRDGNFYVGGNALKGNRYVARLWKYSPQGGFIWVREYDNGAGNTYAQQLQTDMTGNAVVGISSFQSQSATSGQYSLVTVTYDGYGNQVSIR